MRGLAWVVVLGMFACSSGTDADGPDGNGGGQGDNGENGENGNGNNGGDWEGDGDPKDHDVDCGDDYSMFMQPPGSGTLDACVTDEIFCNDEFYGTTVGGSQHYDSDYYHNVVTCSPAGTGPADSDWSAPERVFQFQRPHNATATIWLATPCADLYMRRISRGKVTAQNDPYTELCATNGGNCAGDYRANSTWRYLELTARDDSDELYEIVVDGLDGASGNFYLEVECN